MGRAMGRAPTLFNEPRLREVMERKRIDLIILRTVENSIYASEFFNNGGELGYRPFTVFYFRDPGKPPAFLVPAVDLHLARDSSWIEDVRAYVMAEFVTDVGRDFYPDFFAAAAALLAERKVRNMVVGTEGDNLTAGFRRRLDALLAGNTVIEISPDLDHVRMVKTAEEIRRLRRACDITMKAHESFRAAIRPGHTDLDLHKAAVGRMIAEGAEGVNFINIGCGPGTAYAAHAPFPTGHVMRAGDFVKVDMGARYRGYIADFVRSYFIGRASTRHEAIWRRLNDVQMELGEWIRPGVTGGEIFERGLGAISRHVANFPREFIGHGIGLSSHEEPRMNRSNHTVVEPDTVVCMEFSYYHEGVRLHTEDMFHVGPAATENWTKGCSRDLIVPA
jgi:Xaa-Pro dipeptidase